MNEIYYQRSSNNFSSTVKESGNLPELNYQSFRIPVQRKRYSGNVAQETTNKYPDSQFELK